MDELKFTHNDLLEIENTKLKKALSKANNMLDDLMRKYNTLVNLCSKEQLAELEYIAKRENEEDKEKNNG